MSLLTSVPKIFIFYLSVSRFSTKYRKFDDTKTFMAVLSVYHRACAENAIAFPNLRSHTLTSCPADTATC